MPVPSASAFGRAGLYFFGALRAACSGCQKDGKATLVRTSRAASALRVSCSLFVLAASVSGGSATPPRHERLEALHCPLTRRSSKNIEDGAARSRDMAAKGGADLQNPKPRHRVNRIGFRGGGTQAVAGH